MIIEIKHNDILHETIEVKNAYVLGLNLCNKSERTQRLNIDDLRFDKPDGRLGRTLPNGGYIELLIIKSDEDTLSKYEGLYNLSINFAGVTVEAKL